MSAIFIVTGASSGIGRALVNSLLARAETNVVLGLSRRDIVTSTLDAAETPRYFHVCGDLSSPAGADAASGALLATLDACRDAGGRLAALVQCAGDLGPLELMLNAGAASAPSQSAGRVTDSCVDEMQRTFYLNTLAPLRVTRAVNLWLATAEAAEAPLHLSVSSRAGTEHISMPSWVAYSASKAAMNSVGRTLAAERGSHAGDYFSAHVSMGPGMVATPLLASAIGADGARQAAGLGEREEGAAEMADVETVKANGALVHTPESVGERMTTFLATAAERAAAAGAPEAGKAAAGVAGLDGKYYELTDLDKWVAGEEI